MKLHFLLQSSKKITKKHGYLVRNLIKGKDLKLGFRIWGLPPTGVALFGANGPAAPCGGLGQAFRLPYHR